MSAAGARRLYLPALCVVGILIFSALGIWQVERLVWKRDLIARVEARVNATPAPLPPRAIWDAIPPHDIEYRRVRMTGRFRADADTLVDALTERGAGYWVLTPLVTAQGIVLVNRGFVPRESVPQSNQLRDMAPPPPTTITGLIRLSEPQGRFLRRNQPAQDRWYSRDVEAIAKARRLGPVAPFFIDADASRENVGGPIGGMTVVRFRNAHLVYALTWFALAALCVAGLVMTRRIPHIRD